MSRTYSVAIQAKDGHWLTNYGEFYRLDDIDFEEVEKRCQKQGYTAYGYYYGHNSNQLTSSRCRTVVDIAPFAA